MIHQIKHKFLTLISLAILCLGFVSCNKNIVSSQFVKLPEEGWRTENKLKFEVDIKDNQPYHNVFLNVRHADAYPYSNLFVFLTTIILMDKHPLILWNVF